MFLIICIIVAVVVVIIIACLHDSNQKQSSTPTTASVEARRSSTNNYPTQSLEWNDDPDDEDNSMSRYDNWGGDSSVSGYKHDDSSITVRFSDGSVYRYTESSVGSYNLEEMKRLAERGEGLNSYIMRNCKYDYESKQQGGGFTSDDSWFNSGFDDEDW